MIDGYVTSASFLRVQHAIPLRVHSVGPKRIDHGGLRMKRKFGWLAGALTFALVVAACGGSDDSSDSKSSATTRAKATTTTTAPATTTTAPATTTTAPPRPRRRP